LWTLAGLGIPIDIHVKMIYVLRPFPKPLICPNQIIKTLVMEEKVYFSSVFFKSRPRPGTLRLRRTILMVAIVPRKLKF
jgi:hypothetical protein